MINRLKIPSFFLATNVTSYIDKCSIKVLYIDSGKYRLKV